MNCLWSLHVLNPTKTFTSGEEIENKMNLKMPVGFGAQ